jgi:hypothetical protein
VIENNVAKAALLGHSIFGRFSASAGTYTEVLQVEASGNDLLAALEKTPDSRLTETVAFFTAPKQMGPVPVGDFLWMMLMDSITTGARCRASAWRAAGATIYGRRLTNLH